MDPKHTLGHEMSRTTSASSSKENENPSQQRQNSPDIVLDDSGQAEAMTTPAHRYTLKLQGFLRFLKLQVFDYFATWRVPMERRKIAIYKSHRIAALHSLLHVLPVGGAITLLVLNWTHYFVGPELRNTTALQFVAKFHELLMQTSIIEIIICIIRTQVVKEYVPLGILSASMQAFQISYIWSLNFVSTITSPSFRRWEMTIVITIIPILVLLTALVGPSSAVLMIPRPGLSSTLGTHYFFTNTSLESMFPSHIDGSYSLNLSKDLFAGDYVIGPNLNYRYTTTQTMIKTEDHRYQRLLRYSISKKYENGKFRYSSAATLPTRFGAGIMSAEFDYSIIYPNYSPNSSWSSSTTFSARMSYPIMVVRCAQQIDSEITPDVPVWYIRDDGNPGVFSNFSGIIENYISQGGSNDTMMDSLPSFWSPSAEPGSSSLIGSFPYFQCNPYPLSEMFADEYRNLTRDCLKLLTCTLSAFWETSTHEVIDNDGTLMVRTPPLIDAGFGKLNYTSPISIKPDSILYFNKPTIANESVGQFDDIPETALAISFATALAEVPNCTASASYCRSFLSNDDAHSQGSDQLTSFAIKVTQYGYGYGTSATSVRLSFAVITLYCTVTVGYILYLLITGVTSTA